MKFHEYQAKELLANNSAVLVEEGGQPVGLVTRSDLLEFVAHGGCARKERKLWQPQLTSAR